MTAHALPIRFAIMLIVATTLACAEPPTATKRSFTLEDLKAQIPQSPDGAFLLDLATILNTTTDPEVQSLLSGQPMETTGQILPETEGPPDGRHLRIFRAQMLCCSTHARQCSVAIKLPGQTPALKENTWVKLAGTLTYQREGRTIVPCILVRQIVETTAPNNPILP